MTRHTQVRVESIGFIGSDIVSFTVYCGGSQIGAFQLEIGEDIQERANAKALEYAIMHEKISQRVSISIPR